MFEGIVKLISETEVGITGVVIVSNPKFPPNVLFVAEILIAVCVPTNPPLPINPTIPETLHVPAVKVTDAIVNGVLFVRERADPLAKENDIFSPIYPDEGATPTRPSTPA
jgi:hypothetical protein